MKYWIAMDEKGEKYISNMIEKGVLWTKDKEKAQRFYNIDIVYVLKKNGFMIFECYDDESKSSAQVVADLFKNGSEIDKIENSEDNDKFSDDREKLENSCSFAEEQIPKTNDDTLSSDIIETVYMHAETQITIDKLIAILEEAKKKWGNKKIVFPFVPNMTPSCPNHISAEYNPNFDPDAIIVYLFRTGGFGAV